MAFHHRVEFLVGHRGRKFHTLAQLLGHLEREVGIIEVAEAGIYLVALRASTARDRRVQAVDHRAVHMHVRAVLAAQQRPLLYLVHHVGLHPLLTVHLRGVRVHAQKSVCVVLRDSWQIVDIQHLASLRAHALEAHVLHSLGLHARAEAALRIAQVQQQCLAFAVGVVVQFRGVLTLAGILSLQAPSSVSQVGTHRTRTHIQRQVQTHRRVGIAQHRLVGLILAHKPGAYRGTELAFGQRLDDAVQVHLAIHSAHQALAQLPVATLAASQRLQRHPLPGAEGNIQAQQCIVQT